MKIWLNGKFVKEEEAKVSITSAGFLYGQGVFETMRAYNERVFRLDSHLERLFKALPILNLELAAGYEVLKKAVKQALKENNLKDAYLRITTWQGKDKAEAVVFARNYNFLNKEDYRKGFKAIVSSFRQNEFSVLSGIKSANYLPLLLAYQEAKKKNADEAILLNTRGFLAEASRANIFLVKDNCLLTPSLDCGCLPGITRDTVLGLAGKEKIKVIETKLKPEDIRKADEAFLTNSLVEIMPLVSLEHKPIAKGIPGKITERLLQRYRALV
ncbi:MAG: hypothetical protein A2Y01_03870 [Omnitrophica WOR_2 bacterium GWC2_44_8]|nr:MAG: hypothetical protein A2Y01_03870 [Omnitrophica WOR_2 bacterium GWC2_44_8]